MFTRGKSKAKWVLPALLLALVLAAGAAAYFITPGAAAPQTGRGEVTLSVEEDGRVLLSWPEAPDGARSRVFLRSGEEKAFQLLDEFEGNTAVLDASLLRDPLHIRIQSAVQAKNLLGMERELISGDSIEASLPAFRARQTALSGEGGEVGELLLSWSGQGGYELCVLEEGQPLQDLREVEGPSAVLRFGEDGDLPLPGYDHPVNVTVREIVRGEGCALYGPAAQPLEVRREILLGSTLSLECQTLGERTYALRWNETKGDYYEVQEWSDALPGWETLARVERSEDLRYETGMLRSGSDHRYRVISAGGDPAEPVEPAELSFRAEISTRYATVWPVIEVGFFSDAALTDPLGRIPAGTALCVLEEGEDVFQVRYKDRYGWVDSRFCMINLPEYVGDVCAYDITNSYNSVFMVHEYPIRDITGQVVQGFEGIRTAEDGFLVPYLYPCAKKLLTAAQAAEKDGYRLRIYEAFRPNEATRFLYDTTLAQLDFPVPVLDEETGEYVFYEPPEEPEEGAPDPDAAVPADGEGPEDGEEPEEPVLPPEEDGTAEPAQEEAPDAPPAASEETDRTGDSPSPAEGSAGTPDPQLPESEGGLQEEAQPEDSEESGPTFRQIMTDGRFGINSFLAASVSAHNRGIALDLTIERLDGGPLEMQSAMHDLSWYSATYLNNDNARLLERYMTMPGVGMRGLTSEWWHFQDDETREAIGLTSYLFKGVTAEGWTFDGVGWRYRAADGTYARSTTIRVDGKRYTMDAGGYAAE